MSRLDDLRDEITEALRRNQADYLEIRLEESQTSRLQYRGKELENISKTASMGGNARAMAKGAWGFVSFNQMDHLREKADLAARQASLAGKETSQLAPVSPVVDVVPPVIKKDPTAIPLQEKKQLLDEYNDILLSQPRIQTSILFYSDSYKRTIFASSEGSFIERSKIDVMLRAAAIAREGSEVQQASLSIGSNGDFRAVENLHQQIKEIGQRAGELLSAPPAKSGEYTVVLDPVLAGVFAHEAFGHLSESDFVYEDQRMREIMTLGRRFGSKHLNIVDDPTLPGLRGSYKYDDEGVPAASTCLIREGVLVGRLHSRETAAKMGEKTTGHARALDYHFPPIVRMSNTFIEPSSFSLEELLADIQEGVYAKNWYGGTTSMEMFTFSAAEVYRIREGKIAELLRPVVLTGNLFVTLENIDAIGNDLDMNQGGGCGKGMQVPLPVSNGSPHIRLRHCLVGGR